MERKRDKEKNPDLALLILVYMHKVLHGFSMCIVSNFTANITRHVQIFVSPDVSALC